MDNQVTVYFVLNQANTVIDIAISPNSANSKLAECRRQQAISNILARSGDQYHFSDNEIEVEMQNSSTWRIATVNVTVPENDQADVALHNEDFED